MLKFDNVKFGERLQKARTDAGFTQESLAFALDLKSKAQISRMERGIATCTFELLINIADLLHVSADYLLTGKELDAAGTKAELRDVIEQLKTIADGMD